VRHRDRIAALIYIEAAYRYAYDVPGEFEKDFPTLPAPPTTPPAVARPPFTLPEAERHQERGLPTATQAILAVAPLLHFRNVKIWSRGHPPSNNAVTLLRFHDAAVIGVYLVHTQRRPLDTFQPDA
jgi:hypothetical protein